MSERCPRKYKDTEFSHDLASARLRKQDVLVLAEMADIGDAEAAQRLIASEVDGEDIAERRKTYHRIKTVRHKHTGSIIRETPIPIKTSRANAAREFFQDNEQLLR